MVDAMRKWWALALVLMLAFGLSACGGRGAPPPAKTVAAAPPATAVDGPDKDTKRDDALPLDKEAQETLERVTDDPKGDLAGKLRGPDKTPAGVIEGPLAAQEWPGCRTRFVRNFSQRKAAVRLIVWHQTVSHENGWSSQDALTARANDPRTQVSWTFLIAPTTGLCTYTVPLTQKAWHAGNANSISAGIEVERFGDEATYVSGAGKARLLDVTRRIGRIENIPMQHGIVRFDAACRVTFIKPGILEHSELGRCGGGHIDVTPWLTTALIAEAARASTAVSKNDPKGYRLSVLTPAERRWATCLLEERRSESRAGGWAKLKPVHKARANGCKAALNRRNLELHKVGLTRTAARAARHGVIHEVV